jgi:membrane protein YdbS with pleckstrin-like domain
MKNSNNTSSSSGLGFFSVLTIVFVVLKLVGVINWSWWWVLSPTWIGIALWLIVLVIYVACITCKGKRYGIDYTKKK